MPSRMDAESGPRLLLVAGPGSLGPGLLLILNDELVSRIHLANVYLEAKRRHRSRTTGSVSRETQKCVSTFRCRCAPSQDVALETALWGGVQSPASLLLIPALSHPTSRTVGTVGDSHLFLLAHGMVLTAGCPEPGETQPDLCTAAPHPTGFLAFRTVSSARMDFHRKALVSSVHAGAEEAQLYPCSATHLSRCPPPPSGLSILTCGMRATGLLPADLHVLCCSNSLWTLNTVGTYVV